MPLPQEILAKLTTALSGEVELYNNIINTIQESDSAIETIKSDLTTNAQKLLDAEARGQNYLGQISNLLSKIPIGATAQNVSIEQKMEEIKKQQWTK
jgi:prophage DNA circulation protein